MNARLKVKRPVDEVGFCWLLTSARSSPPNLNEWLPLVLLSTSDHDHVSLTVKMLPLLPPNVLPNVL